MKSSRDNKDQDEPSTGRRRTKPQQIHNQAPSGLTEDPTPLLNEGDYAAPVSAAGVGAAVYMPNKQPPPQPENVTKEMDQASAVPAPGTSSPPILTDGATATNNPRPTSSSSSHGDPTGLSTIPPTSMDSAVQSSSQPPAQQPPVTARDPTTDTSSGATPAIRDTETTGGAALPLKPLGPQRSMTAGTISDLHVPGEFPKTPRLGL